MGTLLLELVGGRVKGKRFQLEVVDYVEAEDGGREEELALDEGGGEFPAVLR